MKEIPVHTQTQTPAEKAVSLTSNLEAARRYLITARDNEAKRHQDQLGMLADFEDQIEECEKALAEDSVELATGFWFSIRFYLEGFRKTQEAVAEVLQREREEAEEEQRRWWGGGA